MTIGPVNRRSMMLGLGVALATEGWPLITQAEAASFFTKYPFQLGVASGSATADGIILWTRLAPDPLTHQGGMPRRSFAVHWVISPHADLSRPVATGTVHTRPDSTHSVHVDVHRLAPATRYWYRFFVGGIASPIGVTKTLPLPGVPTRETRFATLCCQNYAQGYFTAYDALVEDDVDFAVHLGDYIYETGFGAQIRQHDREGPLNTIEDWRRRHALYKMDPSLARAHAAIPFFLVPDNHDAVIDASPKDRHARLLAYRAWMEHMPVRNFLSGSGQAQIAQSMIFGDLLRMELLDTRQYRDQQDICAESATGDMGFGNYRRPCDALNDPRRTMLGMAQEKRLNTAFPGQRQCWNVLASTVPFAPYQIADPQGDRSYVASWNGYPAAQRRMIHALRTNGARNVIVLSGDIHSSWVMDLREKADDPNTAFGTEIIATSVTADCPPQLADPLQASISHNPHVHFADTTQHGYVLHKVSHQKWHTELKFVKDITAPVSKAKIGKNIIIGADTGLIRDII